ncbi:SSI family serine proteinase inhibitor, partial [Streptomyces phyllanthi]
PARPLPHRRASAPRRLRLGVAALGAVAGLVTAPSAAYAGSGTPGPAFPFAPEDRLTVTVQAAGAADGTYELECHPYGGNHPDARDACAQLDRSTTWDRSPFAPVHPDTVCTMQYGGRATAHVTGIWAGRPVDAHFNRRNGCEIARWDSLVPLLPRIRPQK